MGFFFVVSSFVFVFFWGEVFILVWRFCWFFVGFLVGFFIYLKVEPWLHWSPSKGFAIIEAVICKIHQYSGNELCSGDVCK